MAQPARPDEADEARPLQGWKPFRELEDLHSQMGQLMNGVLAPLGALNGVSAPVVEVKETDDAWLIVSELPGVDGKGVHVELRDSELWISGEIEELQRTGILRRRTRRAGRFEFRVPLPGQVDVARIAAKLDSCVLTVRAPKAEPAPSPRSDVRAEER